MTLTTLTTTSLTASQLSVVWAAMDGLYGCIAMVDPTTDTTTCTNGGGVVKIVDSVKDITSGTFTHGAAEVWLCQAGVSEGMTDDDQGVRSIIKAFGEAAHGSVLQQCRSTTEGDDVTITPPTPTIPDPVVTVAQAQASGNATWFLSCPVNNVSYFNITVTTNGTATAANATSTVPVNATAGPSSGGMSTSTSFVASTAASTQAGGASQHRRRDEQQSSSQAPSSSSAANATSIVSTLAPSPTNGTMVNGTVSSNSTNSTNSSDPYAPFIANHTVPLNFTKAANFSLAPNLSLTSVNMSTGLDLLQFNYSMCYWNPGPNTTANNTDGTPGGNPANAARSLGVPVLSACAALLASAALAVVTL